MKNLHAKFAMRLKMFAIFTLAFLATGVATACSGMDMITLAESFTVSGTALGGVITANVIPWMTIKDGLSIFKPMGEDEVKALSEDDRSKYLGDLIKWQTKSLEKLNEDAEKEGADIVALKAEMKELQDANLKSMRTSIDMQGAEMTKMRKELDSKSDDKPLSFKAAVLKALHDDKENITEQLKSAQGSVVLEIKASQGGGDITTGTDFAEMEAGIGQIATRMPFMRSLFVNKNTTKEYVKYNDQETIVRDAKNVAACAATTHLSKITWQVRTMQITKVRDMVDVCLDMMDDYDFVEGEIRELVNTDVKLKVDEQLLLGDNVYPNTNSVDNVASTFAAGAYATSIQDAQLIDLLKIAGAQISDFGQNNKFNANVVLLNPIDACKMQLLKDVDGNYLLPNWITADGINIGSMTIIANQLVPANEAYVMDSSKGTVYSRKGVTVQLAFENKDNFEKELVTVKAYERLNFRVRNVDANAFMHIADIGAAIVAIDKP